MLALACTAAVLAADIGAAAARAPCPLVLPAYTPPDRERCERLEAGEPPEEPAAPAAAADATVLPRPDSRAVGDGGMGHGRAAEAVTLREAGRLVMVGEDVWTPPVLEDRG